MTTIKKLAIASVAAATLAVSFAPAAEARYRHRGHGGWGAGAGIAAGIIGGALLGSALTRPAYGYGYGGSYYAAPAYGGYYAAPAQQHYYAAPAYAAPAVQCQREFSGQYTRSGRPIYTRVCYQY